VSFADRKFLPLDTEWIDGFLVIFKSSGVRKKLEIRNRSGEKAHRVEIQGTDLDALSGYSTPGRFETKYPVERCGTDDAGLAVSPIPGRKCERYLPIVCVPREIGHWKSATAAPDPEDEPPGVRAGSWGFLVFVPVVTDANSVVVVFPEYKFNTR
jgi:hypothetical protein